MAENQRLIDDFRDDFALFIEAGFIAVKQLDEIAAKRLFRAAELLQPDNPASQLGLGYIALNKLQLAEASKIFEAIIADDETHYLAKALLGICYLLGVSQKEKGKQLIEEAKKNSDDPSIENLTKVCLNWIDTDLEKKSFSPLALDTGQEKKKVIESERI